MKIVVASKNPVKLKAAQLGFQSYFPTFDIEGVNAESGVSDQPMSDIETLKGAQNRAQNAKLLIPQADYWIGIEGGIEQNDNSMTAFAWIVVLDKHSSGKSRTTSFQLPHQVVELIRQGHELGHANDIVFSKVNSKQKSGAVGILTKDKLTRTELYKQAVMLALIPFVNKRLY